MDYPFNEPEVQKEIARYQFSRRDPETDELVFLVSWGRGQDRKSRYVCAQSFVGLDSKSHICDLDLGHDGSCFCEVHLASQS